MARLEGWELRLAEVLEAARGQPYALGGHDCFRLACAVVHALTGVDRWPEWAGRYSTKRQALVLLARYGGTFDGAGDKFFGVAGVEPARARRGDILKYVDPDGEAHLGVKNCSMVAVLGEKGLGYVPLEYCTRCWPIG